MSVDPSLALQGALVAAIKTAATAAGERVFDHVPASAGFPRITLGEGQTLPSYADGYDGSEVFIQVDVWSRAVGAAECKAIAGSIRRLVDAARQDPDRLALTGHALELIDVESCRYQRDPDGLTSRAVLTIRALTQPL